MVQGQEAVPTDMAPLLQVQNLHVGYVSRDGKRHPALAGVDFELLPGETLGLLGESGSGKSTLALALSRLLPANSEIQEGSIVFEGQDLLRAEPQALQRIRGARIAMVFQEPSLAMHPTIRIGQQIRDILKAHQSLSRKELRERTLQLLGEVFPLDVERIADSYAHQLSGGQQQRALIAQAIASGPSLIVADEPTASLDPTSQEEILALFQNLRRKFSLSLILITHSPAILQGHADRILVLYAGKVAEVGPAQEILTSPKHPYTRALLESLPKEIENWPTGQKVKLPVIPGEPPNLSALPNGCRFEARCADRMDLCTKREPARLSLSESHTVACFKYGG